MKLTKNLMVAAMLALGTIAGTPLAAAKTAPISTGTFSDLALSGYDTVAYFTDGKPVKGDPKFSYKYEGATWRFASAAHLEAFKADPTKYAPQYGGYCAYAVAKNSTASSDPQAWRIVDGKLFLNYDKDIQKKWEAKQAEFISSANKNWPSIVSK